MTQGYNFYDEIGKKYGAYDIHCNHILKEYPEDNPENVFKQLLLNNSGADKAALDLGCGDGKFTLSIANFFKKIFAIDTSQVLLNIALKSKRAKRISNVIFEFQNAFKTTYSDNFFNIVYSRRGPIPFIQIKRLLQPKGLFIGIEIAELDCKELKVIFGRGQNYKEWEGISRRNKNIKLFQDLNFKVVFAKDYFFTEYYPNYRSLENFLKRVPIFEDFNSDKDRIKLNGYIKKNTTNKRIRLTRHKLVTLFQKL